MVILILIHNNNYRYLITKDILHLIYSKICIVKYVFNIYLTMILFLLSTYSAETMEIKRELNKENTFGVKSNDVAIYSNDFSVLNISKTYLDLIEQRKTP